MIFGRSFADSPNPLAWFSMTRRLLACGCSHGAFGHASAMQAVLRAKAAWKPHLVVHLGDAYDCKAFRTGARPNSGDPDESASVEADLVSGADFMAELRPNVFCMGNHENRLVRLAGHYNQVIATAAQATLDGILASLPRSAVVVPYRVTEDGWYSVADYRFGHGHLYGENFLRDTAEAWGNTVVAHAHRTGMAKGRRIDGPKCYCVGTLADVSRMDYALGRRATLAWSHGFVWGEFTETRCNLWLHEWPRGETQWNLPF